MVFLPPTYPMKRPIRCTCLREVNEDGSDATWSLCTWHEEKAQWAAQATHLHDPAFCQQCGAVGEREELRAALERGVLLPEPEGDGWQDEVRITKGDLHELLNRHAVTRVNAALTALAAAPPPALCEDCEQPKDAMVHRVMDRHRFVVPEPEETTDDR